MKNEVLFVCTMATGLAFCDKGREEHGDYVRLCFLPFSTLKPEWSKTKMTDGVRKQIEEQVLEMQIRTGKIVKTSTCGQSAFLGEHAEAGLAVKSLMKKFPKLPVCENCLEDIACPNCGNREAFKIVMESLFDLFDSGTDDHGDTDWNENSYCKCHKCKHTGIVDDFTFRGLDEAL